jgi:probable F420-dependent oxidoreductase
VKFGLMYDFRNPPPWEVPFPRLYAETLEQVKAVESLGFDSVWVTEHHFTDDGYLPSVLTAAAAIAAVTQRVQIGTSVLLLPLFHPLHVAEDGAVIDLISNGRFIFGPGLGYKLDEFAAFGVNRRHRPSLMEESLEIISRSWTEDRFSFEGRHFQFNDISVTPKPVQKPRPPIWLAGRAEAPLRRAARLADGVIAVASNDLIRRYRDFVAEEGKDPKAATVAVLRSVIISDDPEKTWDEIKDHVAWRSGRYGQWYGEAGDLPQDVQRLERMRSGDTDLTGGMQALIKDSDTVAREMAELEQRGVDHVIFFATLPGYPLSKTMQTWETFAAKVLPHRRGQSVPAD